LTIPANKGKIDSNMFGLGIFFFTLLGIAVGSFLNVCIDRLPANQSLVFPASHCATCGRRLSVKDNIPVFSYLWLRGRCRYCQAPIPRRILWVEIGTGVLFGYLFWHYGWSVELPLGLAYTALFIVLAIIDLEHHLILNKIVYPATAVALVISIFLPPSRLLNLDGSAAQLVESYLPQLGIVQAAIGGGAGLVLFSLIALLSRGGMGWGDAKMAALIGVITGYLVLFSLLLAVILGGLIAVILLVSRLRKRKEGIPFGPFLSLAAVITLLWGNALVNWYLGIL
jgi:leader peptidase (prepilin peptidase)/N-methyltransferase